MADEEPTPPVEDMPCPTCGDHFVADADAVCPNPPRVAYQQD